MCQIRAVPSDVIYRVRGDLRSDLRAAEVYYRLSSLSYQQTADVSKQSLLTPADDEFFMPLLCFSCV